MSVKLQIIFLLAHVCVLCLGYTYESKTGQWYKFHAEGARWTNANRTCVSEGAHLAIINSPAEARVLKDLHQQYLGRIHDADWTYWVAIGIYREPDNTENMSMWDRLDAHGSWKTVDGQTLEQAGYSRWWSGHPMSYPSTGYGFMFYGYLSSFDDSHTAAFICEK